MRRGLQIALTWLAGAIFWLLTGAKLTMDLIGRSTLYEDAQDTKSLIEKAANWLFSTPWWISAALAVLITGYLVYISRPRSDLKYRYDELISQYQLLRAEVAGLSSAGLSSATQSDGTEWADERRSHKTKLEYGKYIYLFEKGLRCVPAITVLPHIPGNTFLIEDLSNKGFTIRFDAHNHHIDLRFFADAREKVPEEDYLESLLEGKWLGDRFVFNKPIILRDEEVDQEYSEPLILNVKECPPNVIAEIYFDAGPGFRGSGLSDGRKAIVGQCTSKIPVNKSRQIVLTNYTPTVPSQPLHLRIKLLGWFKDER